jgi:exopolyphosphatase / guanosine-5'-triphosphate,3'-diphosphate pyrophosphatase
MWGYRVTRAQIRHLAADLAQMTLEKRCKVQGLSPQRADIIVAGLAIIERVMSQLRVNVVQVHTRGVRDGLLLTMVSDIQARATGSPSASASDGTRSVPATLSAEERRAAVEAFAKNCSVDLTHARQVARIAGSLWQQLAEPLKLKAEDRELIELAAMLANVGYLINFEGHHKHSYHLILNSELPGFERRQLQVLANVARYHRGSRPKRKHENYVELSVEDQGRVRALAAILRLALALDRTHQQHVGEVRARVTDEGVRIVVQAHGDAEVDLWAAERKVELFEQVFGRQVKFTARDNSEAARRKRRRLRAARAKRRRSSRGSDRK